MQSGYLVPTRSDQSRRRSGVVVVQVVASAVIIVGFATLSIDVGMMYSAKADLQSIADSSALAGVSQLANFIEAQEEQTTVVELAKEAALEQGNLGTVLGQDYIMTEGDIVFGTSFWNDTTQKFELLEAESGQTLNLNGMKVTVRRQSGTENDSVLLPFAGYFGMGSADIAASATAILVPRDIVIVADLSGSYNDDSELKNYAQNDPDGINLYEVWKTLPKSSADGALLQAWLDTTGLTVAEAPSSYFQVAPGFFSQLGSVGTDNADVFGKITVNSSYNPATDDGLIYLPRAEAWSQGTLGSTNYNKLRSYLLGLGYSDQETRWIMADGSGSDSSVIDGDDDGVTYSSEFGDKDRYDLRAAVALGLVYWNSGLAGGWGDNAGLSGGSGGWGIATDEIVAKETYPYPSGNWFEYIQYMRNANNVNTAYYAMNSIKYRLGAKTFVNYLLEEKERNSETDVTHFAYANPLNLTKNAVEVLMDDLSNLDSGDHIGLVTYGTYAKLDYPLPCDASDPFCSNPVTVASNAAAVETMYRQRQASHYAPSTNVGEGIEFAENCLDVEFDGSDPGYYVSTDFSECHPRAEAQKVIVVLTDGIANTGAAPSYYGNTSTGKAYAKSATQAAWNNLHAKTYAIGVGSGADMYLMDEVAVYGHTDDGFWANGDFSEIQSELEDIFQKIGGRRPVQLID